MKVVPIMKCKNMKESLFFYTTILDFRIMYPGTNEEDPVVAITKDTIELQLSIYDGVFGNPVNVWVNEVDKLFNKYLERGLDTSNKKESPVHQGPLNQTWGTREFYVNDPNGNTLRFCQLNR